MKGLNPSSDLYIGKQTNQIGQTDYVNLLNLSGLEKKKCENVCISHLSWSAFFSKIGLYRVWKKVCADAWEPWNWHNLLMSFSQGCISLKSIYFIKGIYSAKVSIFPTVPAEVHFPPLHPPQHIFLKAAQTPLMNAFISFLSNNVYKTTENYPKFWKFQ